MVDNLPWSVPIATTLYITAHMLLEDNQRRGRHYFSRIKKRIGAKR